MVLFYRILLQITLLVTYLNLYIQFVMTHNEPITFEITQAHNHALLLIEGLLYAQI